MRASHQSSARPDGSPCDPIVEGVRWIRGSLRPGVSRLYSKRDAKLETYRLWNPRITEERLILGSLSRFWIGYVKVGTELLSTLEIKNQEALALVGKQWFHCECHKIVATYRLYFRVRIDVQ